MDSSLSPEEQKCVDLFSQSMKSQFHLFSVYSSRFAPKCLYAKGNGDKHLLHPVHAWRRNERPRRKQRDCGFALTYSPVLKTMWCAQCQMAVEPDMARLTCCDAQDFPDQWIAYKRHTEGEEAAEQARREIIGSKGRVREDVRAFRELIGGAS